MRWHIAALLFSSLLLFVWAEEEKDEEKGEKIKDLSHGQFLKFIEYTKLIENIYHFKGFGTDVEWIGWPEALEKSEELNKPIFLLIHKTWCGACKQLRSSFETSPKRNDFIKLSRKFVMVNVEDDEEPEDDKFAPGKLPFHPITNNY